SPSASRTIWRAFPRSSVGVPTELDVGPRELRTRGGLCSASLERVLAPTCTDEAVKAFELARASGAVSAASITLLGARRSFEAHFLPPSDGEFRIGISSERLKGRALVLPNSEPGRLRVRTLAGNSFKELLAQVHASEGDYMPFSCPTADAISLGGALAVNTHGRTTDTYGGFFADHVPWFRLVGSDGRSYECHEQAPGELERELYRYVPGALGALGLVTELELELCPISPRQRVLAHVIDNRAGDPLSTVASYAALAGENADGHRFRWSEGVSAIFFGSPRRGRSLVMARDRNGDGSAKTPTLPLFAGGAARNALLQRLLHRFPAPAVWLAPRILRRGRTFGSEYYRWAFFQSSYDDAAERLGLLLVHQAWVIPRPALLAFMGLYFDELEKPEHRAFCSRLEFQDLLPVPRSRWPLNASFGHEHGSHVLTISCALPHGRADLLELAQRFCSTLSQKADALGRGVLVQLVKQLHVGDALLRKMYREPLRALSSLKERVDPGGLLRTRTLERLGV
ncbi:MAG TPA: FAD-binding protein, partial [Polyangiaceae bacterium]|nr:FAD-binding protein [Polyangiaceae bacterium]